MRRVLLVNDSEDTLTINASLLKHLAKCEIVLARNAKEAMGILRKDKEQQTSCQERIALVVSDLEMPPGENGVELFRQMRQEGFDQAFILETNRFSLPSEAQDIKDDMVAVLCAKRPKVLTETVNRAFAVMEQVPGGPDGQSPKQSFRAM